MTTQIGQAFSIRVLFGRGCLKAALLAVTLGAACAACASTYTNSATGNWDTDASWTGAKPAAAGAADAEVVFNGAGSIFSTNNLTGTFALNRMDLVAGAVTLSGNALAFTNNGATGPQIVNASGSVATLNNPLVLGRDTTVCTSNSLTLNGLISSKGGLIKTGPYTLTLTNNNNTYVGTTLVSAGILQIQGTNSTATTMSTNFTVQGGATLRVYGGANPFWTAPANSVFNVQSNGTINFEVNAIVGGYLNAASSATVSGSPLLAGVDTVALKTATLGSLSLTRIILQPSGTATPTQTIKFDGTGTGLSIGTDTGLAFSWRQGSTGSTSLQTVKLDVGDSPNAAIDLLVPFLNFRPYGTPGQALIKQGAGLMQVNAADWVSAPTPIKPVSCTVSAGTLVWNTSATNTFGVNFATIAVSNGATLQVGTGGTAGAIYTNVANDGTLVFNRSDAQTFAKVISGAGSVTKNGTNTLTLTGANSYSGGTTVNGGTLVVSAPGSLSGSGTVTVNVGATFSGSGSIGGSVALASGGAFNGSGSIGGSVSLASGSMFSGSGSIGGPVSVAAGATLSPFGTNVLGTLTLASAGADALTLSGSSLLFDLSNVAGTCDQIAAAGTLVLNNASTITLAFPNGTPPAGVYTLLTYAGKTGDGTLKLNTFYPNATLDVGNTNVTLTVTGSGISHLKWKGNVSGIWDTTTANWTRDGVAAVYAEGDAVLFDDTASGTLTVASDSAVSPSSITFDNSALVYALSASIAGSGTPLYKLGTANATLTGTNTYGGGTTLTAGTLTIGAYTNLPATGALTFNGGLLKILGTTFNSLEPYTVNWASFRGGLDLATNNTITVTNVIAGSGSLAKAGAGVLVPLATNTYSGGTTVNGGYVRVYNASALGSGPVNMAGYNNELDLMGGLNITNAITIRGVGVDNNVGSLQSYYGTSNTWSGPVTLGDSGARLGGANATLTVSGVISSGANAWGPVIRMPGTGGGTLILTTNNTWLGTTWIRCGILRLGINNALPTNVSLQLGLGASQTGNVDATLDLAGFNQQVSGLFNVTPIDNGRVVTNSAATLSTLTVNNASTPQIYDGVIAGNVTLVKVGNGTLTLAGTNTTYGGFTVNAGTLAVNSTGTLGVNSTNILVNAGTLALSNSVSLANSATLRIADGGGAKVNLAAGVNEAVGTLWFGDKQKPGGTYGSTGSGAGVIDNEHFAGSGKLTVLHGNGGMAILVR